MGDNILTRFKNWVTVDEEGDDIEDTETYEESDEYENNYSQHTSNTNRSYSSNIISLPTQSTMKVMIVEPKKYEEVTQIADHLKQKKTVIVNLENLADANVRRCIFEFMSGAVYVLEGDMQKVSKGIFILAPHNVNIDASLKKELESKTFFPWNNK